MSIEPVYDINKSSACVAELHKRCHGPCNCNCECHVPHEAVRHILNDSTLLTDDDITARLQDGRDIPYSDLRAYAAGLSEQNAILIGFTREIMEWDNIEGATAFAAETLAKLSAVLRQS